MWTVSHSTTQVSDSQLSRAYGFVENLKNRQDLGFLHLPERTELWTSSHVRALKIQKDNIHLVVLGMGGSSLGGRALLQAVKNWHPKFSVEFIDNVDSSQFWNWLNSRNGLEQTHWVIVSKSGNTIETLTMAELIDQHLQKNGYKGLASKATVISEKEDNPLMRWARREGVDCLEIPKDVGGRFSVLCPVGLLPAAFYGLDLQEIREGAIWAYQQDHLVAQLVAQSLLSFDRKEWITLFWAYSDGLRDFGLWTQQLWAESLGKSVDRKGGQAPMASTPIPATGSSDQHSILQQVMEGQRDKFLWFFRVEAAESEVPVIERSLFDCQTLMRGKSMGQLFGAMATATRQALEKEGVQSLTLSCEKIDAKTMGALFMLMELVVGALGEALNINAFDQPGVELGKRLARQILSE